MLTYKHIMDTKNSKPELADLQKHYVLLLGPAAPLGVIAYISSPHFRARRVDHLVLNSQAVR